MKKIKKIFSLLPCISASHFMLSYSIQCFTIFLVYCTNFSSFIIDREGKNMVHDIDKLDLKSWEKVIDEAGKSSWKLLD